MHSERVLNACYNALNTRLLRVWNALNTRFKRV